MYTQSKRGGSRIRKKRAAQSEASDNKDLNQCTLSVLPETNQGNEEPISLLWPYGADSIASFAEPLSLVAPGG